MTDLSLKKLEIVLNAIRTFSLEGLLRVSQEKNCIALVYKGGHLINAYYDQPTRNDNSEDLLYDLLNWQEGQLKWQAGTVSTDQTLDEQQEADFYQALEELARRGLFDQPQAGDQVALARFLSNAEAAMTPALASTPQTASAIKAMPLPPGQPYTLPHQVSSLELMLARLQESRFNGYINVHPQATIALEKALLVIEEGLLSTAYLELTWQKLHGAAAWEKLKTLPGLPKCEIVTVAPDLLRAYKALLSSTPTYGDLPATWANFKGLLASFERSKRSGVIRLKLGEIELFEFISAGRQLGTYGPEAGGVRLKPLNGLTLVLENAKAQIEVYLSQNTNLVEPLMSLNSTEATTLAGTLSAVVSLLSDLMPTGRADQHLYQLTEQLTGRYPFLSNLPRLIPGANLEMTAARYSNWLSNLHSPDRTVVFKAFEELLERYLQPTCLQIGPPVFHEMVVRALGPIHSVRLQQMGLEVDFFDQPVAMPVKPGGDPGQKEALLAEIENPYDF